MAQPGSVGSCFRSFIISALIAVIAFGPGFARAAPKSNVIRSPFEKETPNGLYLSSQRDSTTGMQVSEASLASIEAYIQTRPDFAPKLVYVNKNTGKVLSKPEDLKKALEAGVAKPVVDRPALFLVGLPVTGKLKRQVLQQTRAWLKEQYPNQKIPVKLVTRPTLQSKAKSQWNGSANTEAEVRASGQAAEQALEAVTDEIDAPKKSAIEYVDLATQTFIYQFPLPQDYMPPTAAEIKTTGWKLLVSNTSQQVFLFFVKPWYIAINSGLMNYANSSVTGVYEKMMGNWFNRSKTDAGRLLKNTALSGFFTTDLYWASRPSWAEFGAITTAKGWAEFAIAKWPSVVFQVFWRYFLGQSLYKWERDMEKRGLAADGRRTRNRLQFLATFLTTPAFIYATIAPGWFDVNIMGKTLLQLNEGHFFQVFIGLIGMLHFYKIFSWDPWVKWLDDLHSFNQGWSKKIGLQWLLDKIEAGVRGALNIRNTEEEIMAADIRNLIGLDPSLQAALEGDPQLLELMRSDPALYKLMETDPHFKPARQALWKLLELVKEDPELRARLAENPNYACVSNLIEGARASKDTE